MYCQVLKRVDHLVTDLSKNCFRHNWGSWAILEETIASRQPQKAGARNHKAERAETSPVWYSLFL